LYSEGKYEEAKAQFERFKREYGSSPFIGQALLGLAACQDAKGNAREAMAAYQDVIARRPGDYVVSQARFSLARLHVAQNEPEKARILLEEVERSDPYSGLGSEAGMRLEELKVKYPKLFAPAAPLATASPLAPAPAVSAVPAVKGPATAAPAAPKVSPATNAAAPKAPTAK
jgi:tetratricopeptide (TPR) repeat protein